MPQCQLNSELIIVRKFCLLVVLVRKSFCKTTCLVLKSGQCLVTILVALLARHCSCVFSDSFLLLIVKHTQHRYHCIACKKKSNFNGNMFHISAATFYLNVCSMQSRVHYQPQSELDGEDGKGAATKRSYKPQYNAGLRSNKAAGL